MLFVSLMGASAGQDGQRAGYDVWSAVTNVVFIYLRIYSVFTCVAACRHPVQEHRRKYYEICQEECEVLDFLGQGVGQENESEVLLELLDCEHVDEEKLLPK